MKTKKQLEQELRDVKSNNALRELWDKVWELEAKVETLEKQVRKLGKGK
jgi:chaperonin cofactor prefoldin